MVCFMVRGISFVPGEKDTSAKLMISSHFLPFIIQPMQVLLIVGPFHCFFIITCVHVHKLIVV